VATVTSGATQPWGQDQARGDPVAWQRTVDGICNRFEDDWLDGLAPRIEEVLAACVLPSSQKAALLAELLKLERELRQRQGETLSASDYLTRFPEHGHVVRTVFGDSQVGPYEVLGLIGEGGMGTVYRVYDPAFRRTVALKVIRSNRLDDSVAQSRFRLEWQLAARLEHDHIVPVFDAGQDGDRLFYTMRYIQGRNLAEVIDHRPLPNHQAARYIEQVARAVDYAHKEQILHRDLKPSNIMIDSTDRAFVTDFGLAKVLGPMTGVATQSTERLGTLAYMAPEQARDPTRAVIESDVYSLGATLFEAVTGRPPFRAATLVAALEQIEKHEPPRPRRLNPAVDRDLETICLKCLEKEPGARYRSAALLADDLRRYLDHKPITVRRSGPIDLTKKWVRRNPSLAALVSVTGLLLFAVVTAFQTQRLKNRAEEREQELLNSYEIIARFAERRLVDRPDELLELLSLVSNQYGDYLQKNYRGDAWVAYLQNYRGDAWVARQSAKILTSLARITDLSGSRADALAKYEEALALWIPLAESAAGDLRIQSALADTWHDLGILRQALGRSTDSLTAYHKAREIRERLVAAEPENRWFRSALARSHGYIGDWELENGRRDDAKKSYDEALRIRQKLHSSDPDDVVATFQLARSYNNSGYLDRVAGNLEASLRANSLARKLQQELVDLDRKVAERRLSADPLNVIQHRDFRNDLANTISAMGVARAELDPVNAKKDQDEALALFDELVKDYPGAKRYEESQSWTLVQLAALGGSRGDLDKLNKADKTFVAREKDNPDVPQFQAWAARSLAVRGEILLRVGETEKEREDGLKYLKDARQRQDRLVVKNPNNFDFQAQLHQTQRALSKAQRD
jgi:serine/threonine protein kinase